MTTTIKPIADPAQIAAIKKPLADNNAGGVRKTFASHVDAMNAFASISAMASAAGIPAFAIPADRIAKDSQIVIGLVGQRIKKDASKPGIDGIKGAVLFAQPTLEQIVSAAYEANDEAARLWLAKIAEKEMSHVAYRELRDAESVEEFMAAAERLPATVADYVIATAREAAASTDAFDAIWTDVRTLVKNSQPALEKRLPTKPEVMKCLRSKSYAEENFPALERNHAFEYLLTVCIEFAPLYERTTYEGEGKNRKETGTVADPQDPQVFRDWLANRPTNNQYTDSTDYSVIEGIDLGITPEKIAALTATAKAENGDSDSDKSDQPDAGGPVDEPQPPAEQPQAEQPKTTGKRR